jgi:hypothetical protein
MNAFFLLICIKRNSLEPYDFKSLFEIKKKEIVVSFFTANKLFKAA